MGCCARCIVVPRCLDFRTTFLQRSSVGGHLTAGDFLPSDIWAIVFSHLSTNELKESSMRVCKDWKQIGEIVMKERFTFQPTEKQAWVLDEVQSLSCSHSCQCMQQGLQKSECQDCSLRDLKPSARQLIRHRLYVSIKAEHTAGSCL